MTEPLPPTTEQFNRLQLGGIVADNADKWEDLTPEEQAKGLEWLATPCCRKCGERLNKARYASTETLCLLCADDEANGHFAA